jgi:D-amino-acid dehydrogenase
MGGTKYPKDQMLTLEPCLKNDLAGAWLAEHDWHLRPDLLIKSWRKLLAKAGVRFIEHARITDMILQNRRITEIITPKGHFTADVFVLATGAWSGQTASMLKMNIPVQPGKGYSITMQRPEPCPSIPCLLSERNMVVTPWPSGFRLGGTMEFSGFNTALNPSRINQLWAGAEEYLSAPLDHPVIENWSGFRPMTSDDLPIIDRSSEHENLYIATGHGMFGLTMATGTGKIVCDLILDNQPDIDITAFSLNRF